MMGAAIDVEVEVAPDVYEAEAPYATFNFNCVPGGYGWIFPKDGYLACGVGSWRRKARLQQGMRDFLDRSFPPGSIRSVQRAGHPIPLFTGHQPIATRRVCLVGDAAGLVDPVMGEGIRMALKSGALAADVIAALLGADTGHDADISAHAVEEPDCRAYQALIRQGIGRDLDMLYRLILPIFVKAPEFFFRTFYGEGRSYYLLSQQLAARLNTSGAQGVPARADEDAA